MFDSDLNQDAGRQKVTRRAFLLSGAVAAAAVATWSFRSRPDAVEASAPSGPVPDVGIATFSPSGEPLGVTQMKKIVKSNAQWRQQLSANAYDITRNADTEMAFSGPYANLHQQGIFYCICCDTALFSSETKFDSGTGWPSFWQPIAKENVALVEDNSFGERTAVACKRCDAHLGHVFNDGPPPTGMRYCMNSASLNFKQVLAA